MKSIFLIETTFFFNMEVEFILFIMLKLMGPYIICIPEEL